MIVRLCRPFTFLRKLLIAAVCIAFAFSAVFLKRLFTLSPLDFPGMLLLVVFGLLAWPALNLAYKQQARFEKWMQQRKKT